MKKIVCIIWTLSIMMLPIHSAQAEVELYVFTEQHEPIEGAVFHLYQDGLLLASDIYSDENGQILITQLTQGTYTLQQVTTQDGYQLEKQSIVFYYEDNQTLSLPDVINKKLYGKLHIEIVDAKGKAMPNIAYTLKKLEGNKTLSYRCNQKGVGVVKNLELGRYQLQVGEHITKISINSKNYEGTYAMKIVNDQLPPPIVKKQDNLSLYYLFITMVTTMLLIAVIFFVRSKHHLLCDELTVEDNE